MNVLIRAAVNTMLETKFLRLRTPVALGSRFDDWQVCWLGGWGKYRLFYLVMVVRVNGNGGASSNPSLGSPSPTCHFRPPSAYGVHMPKKPKVVPITAEEHRLIAMDQKTHRLIVAIGSMRFAIDYFTRISTLPSNTGDQRATVLPIKKNGGKPSGTRLLKR